MKTNLHFTHLCFLLALFLLSGCNGCQNPDVIEFRNTSGNPIGLLLDGRDSLGTFNDREYTLPDTNEIKIARDVIDDQLHGEIAAFTRNRLPFIQFPVIFQEGTDVEVVEFQNEAFIDITVWIVDVNFLNPIGNQITEIINGLLWASDRMESENLGLKIRNIRLVDVTDTNAIAYRDHGGLQDSSYFDNARNFIGYDADRINIYMIRKVGGSRSAGIAEIGGDQIAIGVEANRIDLAVHLMMHNFSLQDTEITGNLNSRNLAHHGTNPFVLRKYLTEGQVFRCAIHPESAINSAYNLRPGQYVYGCPDGVVSPRCPDINLQLFVDQFGLAYGAREGNSETESINVFESYLGLDCTNAAKEKRLWKELSSQEKEATAFFIDFFKRGIGAVPSKAIRQTLVEFHDYYLQRVQAGDFRVELVNPKGEGHELELKALSSKEFVEEAFQAYEVQLKIRALEALMKLSSKAALVSLNEIAESSDQPYSELAKKLLAKQ